MNIIKTLEILVAPTICRTCGVRIEQGTEVVKLEVNYGCRKRIFAYHKKCYDVNSPS
jgi:hypothetical protein